MEQTYYDDPEIRVTSDAPARTRVPAAVWPVIEWLALGLVLACAWITWRAWPSVPIADSDTPGYLTPALCWLSGLGFRQVDGRDWLYPALLALFLKTTGSFTGIVAWQRAFSLLAVAFMAATWRCWVSLLPFRRWLLFLLSLLGILPILGQCLNPQGILFTMEIRPEAVLPCFVYAQLACLMAYCKYRWQKPDLRLSLFFGAAAIVLAYACFVLKPSWGLAFLATSAPVFLGLFGHTLPRRTRLLTPAVGIVCALLLLWLPTKVILIQDRSSRTLLPEIVFCVHAPLIERSLTARIAQLPDSDPEKARLQAVVTVLAGEIGTAAHASHVYEKLGINPDYIMHDPAFTAAIRAYTGNDREKLRAFYLGCFTEAVLHDPASYTRKVFAQFNHFLFPDARTFFRSPENLALLYQDAIATLNPSIADPLRPPLQAMYRRHLADLAPLASSPKPLLKNRTLKNMSQAVAPWALPLELLFLAAWLATAFWRRLRDLRLAGAAAFLLFLAPSSNAFAVCIFHALDIFRFRATYGGYLLFTLATMAVFAVAVLIQCLVGRREDTPALSTSSAGDATRSVSMEAHGDGNAEFQ